jgi:hypothetical protein
MNFGVRLSFASGFILDAMPEWEAVMLLPRAEKLAVFRDPAGLSMSRQVDRWSSAMAVRSALSPTR